MKTKDLSLVAIFTAFIIVLAFVPPINIGLVQIVLQNLGIMLASLLLGMKRGMLAMIIFFLLVTAGMPFLSGGRGGVIVWSDATAGYLWAWLLMPIIVGLLMKLFGGNQRFWLNIVILILGNLVFSYILGALWLFWQFHMPFIKAVLINLPFIPGDLIKIVLVAILTQRLQKAFPGLLAINYR
ncbi:MAG: biotin transporter BioY [Lactobacillus sp.]